MATTTQKEIVEKLLDNLFLEEDKELQKWTVWHFSIEKALFSLHAFDPSQEPHFLIRKDQLFVVGVDRYHPRQLCIYHISTKGTKLVCKANFSGRIMICGVLNENKIVVHDSTDRVVIYDIIKRKKIAEKKIVDFQKAFYFGNTKSLMLLKGQENVDLLPGQTQSQGGQMLVIIPADCEDFENLLEIPITYGFSDYSYNPDDTSLTIHSERRSYSQYDSEYDHGKGVIEACTDIWKIGISKAELISSYKWIKNNFSETQQE